ncbi:hypothetical protein M0R45_024822 [Rubus argutus]|uniref:Uncharacterized protein n=1 Tax=Rubus argutus TaxID=59490 RepID=A0AAW1WW51_RUBAR
MELQEQKAKKVEFKLEMNENKYIDGLKDEYNVVAKWWTEKHKSMVQIDDGSWVLADHEKDEEDEDDDDDRAGAQPRL